MADQETLENPLLSTRQSDSNIALSLHPLVLLTVSDHITRHRIRGDRGPIVGALLGQQKGRETTIEHAFQCKTKRDEVDGGAILDPTWFEERLQEYKDVHKVPALDFVGWFTLCAESGPTPALLGIHKQVMFMNESALLLAFHPAAITSTSVSDTNGKLPLTIYESVIETETGRGESAMQVDGEDGTVVKFRSIPYTIETDETEMIAIDYVARGAGSAAAVDTHSGKPPKTETSKQQPESKGKKRADVIEVEGGETKDLTTTNPLTTEEEDHIAGLTTRLNSVRMLQSRLSLLSAFIRSQPPSYLADASTPITATSPNPTQLPHLRSIQALLTRLALLTPSSETTTTNPLSSASLSQSNDVALTQLLSLLGQDVQGLSEMGRKFASVEQQKSQKGKGNKLSNAMSEFSPGAMHGDFHMSSHGSMMV